MIVGARGALGRRLEAWAGASRERGGKATEATDRPTREIEAMSRA